HVFDEVRKALKQAEGADHVGPLAQLHCRPDLAVEPEQERQRHQQRHDDQKHLPEDQQRDPQIRCRKELNHLVMPQIVGIPFSLQAVTVTSASIVLSPSGSASEMTNTASPSHMPPLMSTLVRTWRANP